MNQIITISREFGSGGRELLGGGAWDGGGAYRLTVNTTDWEIKELAPAVADFASRWFRRT